MFQAMYLYLIKPFFNLKVSQITKSLVFQGVINRLRVNNNTLKKLLDQKWLVFYLISQVHVVMLNDQRL